MLAFRRCNLVGRQGFLGRFLLFEGREGGSGGPRWGSEGLVRVGCLPLRFDLVFICRWARSFLLNAKLLLEFSKSTQRETRFVEARQPLQLMRAGLLFETVVE